MIIAFPFFFATHQSRLSTMLCSLTLGIMSLGIPTDSLATTEMVADPLQFLRTHPSELLSIQSQEEAIQLFLQSNPALLTQLATQPTPNSRAKIQIPAQVQEAITHIMAGLVALRAIQSSPNSELKSGTTPVSPAAKVLAPKKVQWMANTPIFAPLARLTRVQQALASVRSAPESPIDETAQAYRQFEEYTGKHHPIDADGPTSWITLLENEGVEGIQAKLHDYQNSLPASHETNPPSPSDISHYAQHYLRTRLAPLFQTYSQDVSHEVQRQAYEVILTHMPIITDWAQQKQERTMLSRLCGSWHWTIHNHQNHQDHKMTVHFSPPGEPLSPDQPTPSSFSVQGDTVYLRWVFQQGKQEDSLLLSNQDTILEGTFQSTMGPYGSISGKRMTTCKP